MQYSHPGSDGMNLIHQLPSSMAQDVNRWFYKRVLDKVSSGLPAALLNGASAHLQLLVDRPLRLAPTWPGDDAQVPLFAGCENAFIAQLVMRLKLTVLMPSEIIFRIGDVGHEMYFISKVRVTRAVVCTRALTAWTAHVRRRTLTARWHQRHLPWRSRPPAGQRGRAQRQQRAAGGAEPGRRVRRPGAAGRRPPHGALHRARAVRPCGAHGQRPRVHHARLPRQRGAGAQPRARAAAQPGAHDAQQQQRQGRRLCGRRAAPTRRRLGQRRGSSPSNSARPSPSWPAQTPNWWPL